MYSAVQQIHCGKTAEEHDGTTTMLHSCYTVPLLVVELNLCLT